MRWDMEYLSRHVRVGLRLSCAQLGYQSTPRPERYTGWRIREMRVQAPAWCPAFVKVRRPGKGFEWRLWLPLGLLVVGAVVSTAFLWRRDGRRFPTEPVDYHARFRRLLKWLGLTVCLLFIAMESMTATQPPYRIFEALFVINAITTGLLWWQDNRSFPAGYCRNCGYDLTANVSGRCPECGKELDS